MKEVILSILEDLKIMGKSRGDIEKDLKLSHNYISQAISRGGNEVLLKKLQEYKIELEEEKFELYEEQSEYKNKNQIIKALEEQVLIQKKYIDLMENRLKELEERVNAKDQQSGRKRHSA